MKPNLNEQDFLRASALIPCDVPAIRSICEVEAPRGAFLDDDRPTILFERHKFSQFTSGRYDAAYPEISNPSPGGYGQEGAWQHERLAKAATLDREAALKSASWGAFQLMGFNFMACGFTSIQEFVNAMYRDAPSQMIAFVNFVKNDTNMKRALVAHDWPEFARRYNGPNYAINKYDKKLAAAYAKWGGK